MILNAKVNAFLLSQNYDFTVCIWEILLEFRVQKFSDVCYLLIF